VGTLSAAGVYSATASNGGKATVRATVGSVSGTAAVTALAMTGPRITTPVTVTAWTMTTLTLTVGATDPAGTSGLTYTWILITGPGALVTFSPNGTHAASTTTITFTAAGTYTFQVTVKDPAGLTAVGKFWVTSYQVATAITLTPATLTLTPGATQQFTAVITDQFHNPIVAPLTITWYASAGRISSTGLFTAPATSGPVTVTAACGGLRAQLTVTVQKPPATTAVLTHKLNQGLGQGLLEWVSLQ
jgi:hypothetical protein